MVLQAVPGNVRTPSVSLMPMPVSRWAGLWGWGWDQVIYASLNGHTAALRVLAGAYVRLTHVHVRRCSVCAHSRVFGRSLVRSFVCSFVRTCTCARCARSLLPGTAIRARHTMLLCTLPVQRCCATTLHSAAAQRCTAYICACMQPHGNRCVCVCV